MKRWKEEVELLQEEMRRVKATFTYLSELWQSRTSTADWDLPQWSDYAQGTVYRLDPVTVAGRIAYARKQSYQFRKLHEDCINAWRFVDDYLRSAGATPLVPPDIMLEEDEREGERGGEGGFDADDDDV